MQFVKEIFQERVNEINRYYTFISSFSLENPDKELNKILRSNLILMLYNLVESSITNSIEEIHSNIYTNRISFNVLNIELKKILIRQIKNMNPHTFVQSINDITIRYLSFIESLFYNINSNIIYTLNKSMRIHILYLSN